MKNFVQDANTITLTAPYTVASGAGAQVGAAFGVAQVDVAIGADGSFAIEGMFDLAKTSAQAWTQGQKIYWDNTNKRCDSDPSLGMCIGFAAEVTATSTATGKVVLEPPMSKLGFPAIAEGSQAAVSKSTAGAVTLTAAELLKGLIVADPNGAGRTYTLPTAALLVAAMPNAAVGDMLRCYIVNGADAAETITLAEGTGGGWDANQTSASRVIPQNTSKTLHVRLTNVTASSEAYVAYA